MTTVKFTATKLSAKGKKGILTPDADGYYTMPVGGLNAFNSTGQYYVLEGAKELFEDSSILMRRIKNGCFKGEVGHPKKSPGMTMDDYVNRILTIDETNVCVHFKELWLDDSYGKLNPEFNNPNLVAIMAKLKPTGPKGEMLKASLDNPDENVCFSIRALSRDYFQRGQCYKVVQSLVAIDYVNEGGINIASKWSAPALESIDLSIANIKSMERIVHSSSMVATEDSKMLATEALSVLMAPEKKIITPGYYKW